MNPERNSDVAIRVTDLKKSYGALPALKGVSFSVSYGEMFGLIGPDGAGKTTLMRILSTLLVPDEGQATVGGMDVVTSVSEIRAILGYMPQRFSLYSDLSVEQNLQFFADLFQVPDRERERRLRQLYQFSRLEPFKKRKAGALSGGMKQKLALSCALIHTPRILILDEPTTGVDPASRGELWEILEEIKKEGTAILVSTPYMDEADRCDRVGLMFAGQLIAVDHPREIRRLYRHPLYRVEVRHPNQLRPFFAALSGVRTVQIFGDALHISFHREPTEQEWKNWEKEAGESFLNVQKIEPTIEDVFLDLMEPAHG